MRKIFRKQNRTNFFSKQKVQLYLVSFHSGDFGLLHRGLVSGFGGQELFHLLVQGLEVEDCCRGWVDGEPLDLDSLLGGSSGRIENLEAIVLGAAGDKLGDVGSGAVAFQLISQVSQEASGGQVESVLCPGQVDDGVWKANKLIFCIIKRRKSIVPVSK